MKFNLGHELIIIFTFTCIIGLLCEEPNDKNFIYALFVTLLCAFVNNGHGILYDKIKSLISRTS
jgi:hypothetical protein